MSFAFSVTSSRFHRKCLILLSTESIPKTPGVKINVRTSNYFSGTIMLLGGVLVVAGMLALTINIFAGVIILMSGLIIFTTHYRMEIDDQKKEYYDYLWILGIKNGERGKYEKIEYMFIKKSLVSQTMNMRVASSTIRKAVYDGYLKLSEQNKIHIASNDSREGIMKVLRMISEPLGLEVVDYSSGEPVRH